MNTRYATMSVVAAALLLSGLSLISSYQPAIAQVEMTGEVAGGGAADNATTTMGSAAEGGNATDAAVGANQSELRPLIEEALAALQNNDTQGAMTHLELVLGALGGNSTTTAGFVEVEDEDEEGGVEVEDEDEGVDDVDEPGDIDVNDEEDTDTGNEDAGEVEDEDEGGVGAAGGVGAG
jgi:hypothetical protein